MAGFVLPEQGQAPIVEALPELCEALRSVGTAILSAPPGAGKSTVTPLALLDQPWVADGRILVLEPRRIAARAVAARMAESLSEEVGQTVGYRVRFETRVSPQTRIEVVTTGVYLRRILEDPGLDGVAAVLFDEFHERALECDVALALTWEARRLLRDDLRLMVMSATLESDRLSPLLNDAPRIVSRGQSFPVETRYLGRDPGQGLAERICRAAVIAARATAGDVLVFLPGVGEIMQVRRRLEDAPLGPAWDLCDLHGSLELADQAAVLAPAERGRRKLILATAIAETSLTLPGIEAVVDSGLARTARWDGQLGLPRLETTRVSRAAADQRRGRAGRTGPGQCWRLWDQAEDRSLPPFDEPEIFRADLSALLLSLASWGLTGPDGLAFLDPPSKSSLDHAAHLLKRLGALDEAGRLTARGKALLKLGLPPRLGQLLLLGAELGLAQEAAEFAVVLGEPSFGGRGVDIAERRSRFRDDRGARARRAGRQVQEWRGLAESWLGAEAAQSRPSPECGVLIAAAFPEWIARQSGDNGVFNLANGRGAIIDPQEPLAREAWLAVAELAPGQPRDRIRLAAPLHIDLLRTYAPHLLRTESAIRRTPSGRRVAESRICLGSHTVEVTSAETLAPDLLAADLLAEVREVGLDSLAWGPRSRGLRNRARFLAERGAWASLDDVSLKETLEVWLLPALDGKRSLSDLDDAGLAAALLEALPNGAAARLAQDAPPHWTSPAGGAHPIDYSGDGGPRVEVRVQSLYGLTVHPRLSCGAPLVLALLSPAGRPIQLTNDLPGFWAGTWRDVRKEMRGRYPKHDWPERPDLAKPSLRSRKA